MNLIERIKTLWFVSGQTAVTPKPEISETATDVTPYYIKSQYYPENSDAIILKKGSMSVFDDMHDDYQIDLCSKMKRTSILGRGWELVIPENKSTHFRKDEGREPNEDELKEIRDWTWDCLENTEDPFNNILLTMLLAFDYGYSVSEIVYQTNGDSITLKNIKPRPPHSFRFEADQFGNLNKGGLKQYQGFQQKSLDPEKFVVMVPDKRFGNWNGKPDLTPQYIPYFNKKKIAIMWNVFLERFGAPTVIGKYKTSWDENKRNKFYEMLTHLQSGTVATIPDDGLIEFMQVAAAAGGMQFENAIKFWDIKIAQSSLIPSMLVSGEQGGSYAKGQMDFELFIFMIESRRALVENILQNQLVKRVIDINYGKLSIYPYFKFLPITEDAKQKLIDNYSLAVEKGIIKPTLEDENKLRGILDLTLREETPEEKKAKEEPVVPPEQKPKEPIPPAPAEKPKQVKQVNQCQHRKTKDFQRKPVILTNNFDLQREPFTLEARYKTFDFAIAQYKQNQNELAKSISDAFMVMKSALGKKLMDIYPKLTPDKLTSFLEMFEMPNVNAVRKALLNAMQINYNNGVARAKAEYKQMKKPAEMQALEHEILEFTAPVNASEILKALAYKYAGDETGYVASQAKDIIIQGAMDGDGVNVILKKVNELFKDYEYTTTDKGVQLGGRLSEMTRDELNETFQRGHREWFEAPEMDNFVIGYQYSAILDSRTTIFCEENDGLYFEIETIDADALTPPVWYNCRSDLVAVSKFDVEELGIKFSEPIGEPPGE